MGRQNHQRQNHQLRNGYLSLYYGLHRLGRYNPQGRLLHEEGFMAAPSGTPVYNPCPIPNMRVDSLIVPASLEWTR